MMVNLDPIFNVSFGWNILLYRVLPTALVAFVGVLFVLAIVLLLMGAGVIGWFVLICLVSCICYVVGLIGQLIGKE